MVKKQVLNKQWKRLLKWLPIDIFIITVAYFISFSLRALTTSLDVNNILNFLAVIIFITCLSLYFNDVYRIFWKGTSGHSVSVLFRATVIAFVIIIVVDLLIQERPVPLSVLFVTSILSFGGFVIVRYRTRLIGAVEWRWRAIWLQEFPGENRERVLIVGAGESGQTTARRLSKHSSDAKYDVIGFVDDDHTKQNMLIEGRPVIDTTDHILRIVKTYNIDLLIVAIHNIEGAVLRNILEQCEQTNARIKVVPDILKIFDKKLTTSFLRDIQPEDIIGRTMIKRDKNVDLNHITDRVVLVTGAAGSIGSELCHQLLEYHHPKQLIVLDNNESALFDLNLELKMDFRDADIKLALVDVTQSHALQAAFDQYRPQIVFHAAAYKHVPMLEVYPNEAVRVNIRGTLNTARVAQSVNAERFVLISTDKAVDPSSVMGASKRICEILIHLLGDTSESKTLFTAVRFGNVLGSRGSVVPIFNRQIDFGGPVTVTDKEMTRYFMSISEACNLVIHAAAMTQGHDIYVLKMGEVVRIYDLAKRMIRLRGLRPGVDIDIKISGIRAGEKLHEQLTHAFESLEDTQHPGITRMRHSSLNGYSGALQSEIMQLVENGLHDLQNPLGELRAYCDKYSSNVDKKVDYDLG